MLDAVAFHRNALQLSAIFKEKKLGLVFLGEIKADSAVASDEIAWDAATGAHTVDLVDAEVSADVEFAPGFDDDGLARLFGQENFQGWPFVLDVGDRRGGFQDVVIQAV